MTELLQRKINHLLDEMAELKRMLRLERQDRAQDIAAAIEKWKGVVQRQKAEAVKWHGKYAIVKAENNALRRAMYRQNRGGIDGA